MEKYSSGDVFMDGVVDLIIGLVVAGLAVELTSWEKKWWCYGRREIEE